MVTITEEQIRTIFPGADDRFLTAFREHGQGLLDAAGITLTSERASYFLAQLSVEIGDGGSLEENLYYTTAERLRSVWPAWFPSLEAAEPYLRNPERLANFVYANRVGNGPPESGDGWRYRGRGYIQLTFRDNYRKVGELAGHDFEANPEAVADPALAWHATCGYWRLNNLNRFADAGNFDGLTAAINQHTNTYDKRRKALERVRAILAGGWSAAVAGNSGHEGEEKTMDAGAGDAFVKIRFGDRGTPVVAIQRMLNDKNYHVGAVDGVFGNLTRTQVLGFQADNGLPTTGIIDATTFAAFASAPTRPIDAKRATATATDLRNEGSRTILGLDRIGLTSLIPIVLGALGLAKSAAGTIATTAAQNSGAAASAGGALPEGASGILGQAMVVVKGGMGLCSDATATAASDKVAALCQDVAQLKTLLGQLQSGADPLTALLGDNGALVSTLVSTLVPGGAAGSIVAVAAGVFIRMFVSGAVAARVEDHRDAANTGK